MNSLIYNLLDNAQKYTEDQPEISIVTADVDGGLEISVRDNGIGIPENQQEYLENRT